MLICNLKSKVVQFMKLLFASRKFSFYFMRTVLVVPIVQLYPCVEVFVIAITYTAIQFKTDSLPGKLNYSSYCLK